MTSVTASAMPRAQVWAELTCRGTLRLATFAAAAGPKDDVSATTAKLSAAVAYIAASRSVRAGVVLTSSFLCRCCAAKIIARSARAVIVKSGLTPIADGTAAPSHT